MNTQEHLKNYLRSIFDYYNLKYKLNVTLQFEFTNVLTEFIGQTAFIMNKQTKESIIILDFEELNNKQTLKNLYKRIPFKTKLEFYIKALLHEIKHAIEYKTGLIPYERKIGLYFLEHDKRPSEIRADYFANTEIKKWL